MGLCTQGVLQSDQKGAKMRIEGRPRSHLGTHEPDPEGMRFVEVDMSADEILELSPEQSSLADGVLHSCRRNKHRTQDGIAAEATLEMGGDRRQDKASLLDWCAAHRRGVPVEFSFAFSHAGDELENAADRRCFQTPSQAAPRRLTR